MDKDGCHAFGLQQRRQGVRRRVVLEQHFACGQRGVIRGTHGHGPGVRWVGVQLVDFFLFLVREHAAAGHPPVGVVVGVAVHQSVQQAQQVNLLRRLNVALAVGAVQTLRRAVGFVHPVRREHDFPQHVQRTEFVHAVLRI